MKPSTAAPPARALALALASALLAATAPTPRQAVHDLHLHDLPAGADPTAAVVAAVAVLAWLLAGWLAATVALALAAQLPGAGGRTAAWAGRRVAPATVRRAVEVALGLTVATGALGATAATAAPAAPVRAPVAVVSAAPLEPDGGPAPLERDGGPGPLDLDWPATQQPPAGPTEQRAVRGAPVSAATGAEQVVVRPGDTLWALAEQSLAEQRPHRPSDAQVAAAWPQWWAANRDAIGPDPDLLLPGTSLQPPAPSALVSPDG